MEQQHGFSKRLELFLEDVAQQIQYKPIRNEIKAELTAHIEDRREEYVKQGLEDSKAWNRAIEDMGDAVEIGVKLNEARKVQKNKLSIILVMTLTVIGIIGNIRVAMLSDLGIWYTDFLYFLFGIVTFALTYYYGYQLIAKNGRKILWIILGGWIAYFLLLILQRHLESRILFDLTSISLVFAVKLLCIPVVVVIAYYNRGKKYIPIILTTLITIIILAISSIYLSEYYIAANLVFIITIYTTLMYMIVKGLFKGAIRFQIISWTMSLGMVLAVFIISFNGSWKYQVDQFIYPEKVADDKWDDAYNSILIKDLLRKASVAGTIDLSQEELMSYYIGEWYFNSISDFDYKYKMQFVKENSVTLENVMPQHYHNNYRIAFWILKYGWAPFMLLLGVILTTYGILIQMVRRIKNNMGMVLAFSCILILALQMAIYMMGNLGYQIGWFCNFPFISEGLCSITSNMILVGMACSAYRYDKVNIVKEKRHQPAKNCNI